MIETLDYHWTSFNGWAVAQGLDILELPLDSLLDLVYYWLTKDAEEDDVAKLDSQLWLPPTKTRKGKSVTAPKNSPWSDEATLASFSNFMQGVAG